MLILGFETDGSVYFICIVITNQGRSLIIARKHDISFTMLFIIDIIVI